MSICICALGACVRTFNHAYLYMCNLCACTSACVYACYVELWCPLFTTLATTPLITQRKTLLFRRLFVLSLPSPRALPRLCLASVRGYGTSIWSSSFLRLHRRVSSPLEHFATDTRCLCWKHIHHISYSKFANFRFLIKLRVLKNFDL